MRLFVRLRIRFSPVASRLYYTPEIRPEGLVQKPRCILPWYQMVLFPDGGQRPCCGDPRLMDEKIPLDTVQSCKELFNSREMVRLRKALLSGAEEGTVCEGCPHGQTEIPVEFYATAMPEDRLRAYLESIADFPEVIDSPPLQLWLQLSKKCNLNCIMCLQKPLQAEDMIHFPVDEFTRMLEHDGLDAYAAMIFWGGEPLFCQDGLKLIEYFSRKSAENALPFVVQMITNGTEICKQADKLSAIKRLCLHFSIDAVGAGYEAIRRGAKYSDLAAGINWYRDRYPQYVKWSSINCVIMKCNVLHLQEVIDLCSELGMQLSFTPVSGCPEENILENPALIVSEALYPTLLSNIESAKRAGHAGAAASLENFLRVYKNKLAAIAPVENCTVAIYGAGARAQELRGLLECYRKDLQVAFQIDSFRETDRQAGIVNVSDLKKYADEFAWILIASAYREEIAESLKQAGFERFSDY